MSRHIEVLQQLWGKISRDLLAEVPNLRELVAELPEDLQRTITTQLEAREQERKEGGGNPRPTG